MCVCQTLGGRPSTHREAAGQHFTLTLRAHFMPTRDRYREYREDQTTIWVSKAARAFLDREKKHSRESTTSVGDRLLRQTRGTRRRSKKEGRFGCPRRGKRPGA